MGALVSFLPTSGGMYSLEDVQGKGKGLIASKDITKGTRIISEVPVMAMGRQVASMKQLEICIFQEVCSLSAKQQQEFLSMDNVYPYTTPAQRFLGIFRTNALPVGPNLVGGGIFFKACRINHACDNNTQNFWNENLDQLTIHAVRDICKGEEITITYLRSLENRNARHEQLWENFKFRCSCGLCSLPFDQSRDSDTKLDRIHEIDCIIEQGGIEGLVTPAKRMLSYVDEQVRLWNDFTPNEVGLARAYPDAFQIAIANGDLARARIFAERLVLLYRNTLGDDSPGVIEYSQLVQNPATHKYYGMSMKWKSTLDGIPQALEAKEFENWLWKRR